MPRDDQDYPIIPHEAVAEVDCGGCLYVRDRGEEADILCSECGALVRTVPADEAAAVTNALITEIASTAFSTARCPLCGAWNTFPGFTFILVFPPLLFRCASGRPLWPEGIRARADIHSQVECVEDNCLDFTSRRIRHYASDVIV